MAKFEIKIQKQLKKTINIKIKIFIFEFLKFSTEKRKKEANEKNLGSCRTKKEKYQ